MTQTNYDKALKKARMSKEIDSQMISNGEIFDFAFRKGYEFGKRQSTTDHERNLVALGDDYATARVEAMDDGFDKWYKGLKNITDYPELKTYIRGWNDADTFDSDWTSQHPKDLLDRILDEYPDMIENKVKARMKDLQNEQADHFRDDTKKVRMEIAMRAMAAIIPTTSPKNYQTVAQVAVNYADALLAELEKTSNFSNP